MINRLMKNYNYYTYNNLNEYGQYTLSNVPTGSIKIAIYLTSQNIQDNINYQNANYVGLTHSEELQANNVIEYDNIKLKVLYINNYGKYKQVFMSEI